MFTIFAIDLGKFKSVIGGLNVSMGEAMFRSRRGSSRIEIAGESAKERVRPAVLNHAQNPSPQARRRGGSSWGGVLRHVPRGAATGQLESRRQSDQ
jgi:hypothetical protein